MSNKEYPLHPGQTQASSDYVQVPQSEYESLKRENKQLHALLHGANRQGAQEEIVSLKEAQRWRKFNIEPPAHHQWIEACFCEDMKRQPRIDIRRWDDGMKYDVFEQELYIGWRPLPKAPEGK